jgi:hypothetical protein
MPYSCVFYLESARGESESLQELHPSVYSNAAQSILFKGPLYQPALSADRQTQSYYWYFLSVKSRMEFFKDIS